MKTISRREFMQGGLALTSLTLLGPAFTGCGRRGTEKGSSLSTLAMQSPWVNDAEFIGYFTAMENHWYEDEGLFFRYLPGGPEKVAETVVLAGQADLALTTPDTTINAIVKEHAPFKIIGTQYQKNPLGVVSLVKNNIKKPKDLVGRVLAVPTANIITVEAMLKLNGIQPGAVKVVPYQYDPTPLLKGEVDATIDFVTNVPYTIRERGGEPTSFLLYDYGFTIYNDTVVVTTDTLEKRRGDLIKWLRASRRGWNENFKDPSIYPPKFENTYFKGTGRSIANEIFFNSAQRSLIESPTGIFSLSEKGIEANNAALNAIGIPATRDMFVTDLLAQI